MKITQKEGRLILWGLQQESEQESVAEQKNLLYK